MLKNKQLDIFSSIIVLIFCAGVYHLTLQFPAARGMGRGEPIGAQGFPQLLVGLIAFMAVIVIIQALFSKTADEPAKVTGRDFWVLLKFIVAWVAYIYAIRYIGYGVSTLLFMMFCMWWMGVRKPVSIVLTSVAVTVLIYLCFGMLFGVELPPGFLI